MFEPHKQNMVRTWDYLDRTAFISCEVFGMLLDKGFLPTHKCSKSDFS